MSRRGLGSYSRAGLPHRKSECGKGVISFHRGLRFLGPICNGYTPDLDGLRAHCGGSDPRYAEIAIISSSERFETTFFISAAAVPALDPF